MSLSQHGFRAERDLEFCNWFDSPLAAVVQNKPTALLSVANPTVFLLRLVLVAFIVFPSLFLISISGSQHPVVRIFP